MATDVCVPDRYKYPVLRYSVYNRSGYCVQHCFLLKSEGGFDEPGEELENGIK